MRALKMQLGGIMCMWWAYLKTEKPELSGFVLNILVEKLGLSVEVGFELE